MNKEFAIIHHWRPTYHRDETIVSSLIELFPETDLNIFARDQELDQIYPDLNLKDVLTHHLLPYYLGLDVIIKNTFLSCRFPSNNGIYPHTISSLVANPALPRARLLLSMYFIYSNAIRSCLICWLCITSIWLILAV